MTTFIYDNGCGNMTDESGKDIIGMHMEVDDEMYPIESITNYNQYMDVKPPEPLKDKKLKEEEGNEPIQGDVSNKKSGRVSNKHYKDMEKEQLFYLVYEKGMPVRAAALQPQIKPRAAQYWVQKDQQDPQDEIQRKIGSGRPRGKSAILGEEHKQFLVDMIDKNPSLVLDQMMASLTNQFAGLEIGKTALYNFVTKNARLASSELIFTQLKETVLKKLKKDSNG
jgi:transposase